jgi:multidrug resistance efflux pump
LSAAAPPESPLITLLALTRRAREAAGRAELAFMAVNDSHGLAPYRQAALWFPGQGVNALSGVVQVEANVPYVQWLARVFDELKGTSKPMRLTAEDLSDAEAADWGHWLPAHGLAMPLKGTEGLLLLARDTPWQDRDIALLAEWLDAWSHAWRALGARGGWHWPALVWRSQPGRPWWKRWPVIGGGAALLAMLIPVRLTVLAPGELVPLEPAVIRAPFDGVVGGFLVKPNDLVKAGQPLFSFDDATLVSRLEVARQALATAEAEYRQATQQALSDARAKSQLVVLAGKIEERRAEAAYLQGQLERSRVVAPRDGVALFDDPAEWIGKPVVTGERILRVAAPDQVEVEAWLPVGDAIPLEPGAAASLYLNATPLDPVDASVRYVAHDAAARPDGSYAYRVRAKLDERTSHRVGLKGTVKLSGGWVPLGYWMLRRPVAAVRQFLGL